MALSQISPATTSGQQQEHHVILPHQMHKKLAFEQLQQLLAFPTGRADITNFHRFLSFFCGSWHDFLMLQGHVFDLFPLLLVCCVDEGRLSEHLKKLGFPVHESDKVVSKMYKKPTMKIKYELLCKKIKKHFETMNIKALSRNLYICEKIPGKGD